MLRGPRIPPLPTRLHSSRIRIFASRRPPLAPSLALFYRAHTFRWPLEIIASAPQRLCRANSGKPTQGRNQGQGVRLFPPLPFPPSGTCFCCSFLFPLRPRSAGKTCKLTCSERVVVIHVFLERAGGLTLRTPERSGPLWGIVQELR